MLKKWNKTALIVVPLLVVGSVATFAAENAQSTNKQATASAPASTKAGQSDTVTSQVVSSQTLTPEEMQQLQQAKPTATTTASSTNTTTAGNNETSNQDQSLLDANNPFLVQGGNTGSASASDSTDSSAGTGANGSGASTGDTTAGNNNFSLDLVKNLDITMNTTQGMLTLHFRTDGGKVTLDGTLGGRHVTLAGDQAVQILNGLLQSANLSDALTASLNGQQVNLDPSLLGALQTLHVDLKDGRKIDTNPHGGAQGNDPKAVGRHDNGKHKGQEKPGKGHGEHEDD